MTLASLRSHLTPFSIVGKRRTTIAHAFASAIAPAESFDFEQAREAIAALRQDESDIRCIYCGEPAETWDHLVAIVLDKRSSGYGHTLGNLVPSCKKCNSAKGNRDWRTFLRARRELFAAAVASEVVEEYQQRFSGRVTTYEELKSAAPAELREYEQLESRVLALMAEADQLARRIRDERKMLSPHNLSESTVIDRRR